VLSSATRPEAPVLETIRYDKRDRIAHHPDRPEAKKRDD
jgi:hypothetical protein